MNIDRKTLIEVIQSQDRLHNVACQNNYSATGIEFDSRKIQKNNIFVALAGKVTNGHNYIKDAHVNQASMFIVDNNFTKRLFDEPEKLISVTDPLTAFYRLAIWNRKRLNIPVIAVTGSAGKTTVKSMIAEILSGISPGAYSQKSYNNHVGVAHTVCNINQNDNWAVVEMGMNHLGEIKSLSEMTLPDIGVITSIGPAHIGMLGSLENIAQAKLEIISGIKPGAPIIIPYNNQVLYSKIAELNLQQKYVLHTFGLEQQADCSISNIQQRGLNGVAFELRLFGESIHVFISSLGIHNVFNAACAALACKIAFPAIPAQVIKHQLERYVPNEMRLNIIKLDPNKFIINDAYNSNPAAISAALKVIENLKQPNQNVGVIIGDMLELGDHSEYYHKQIAKEIAELNPKFVVMIGKFGYIIAEIMNQKKIAVFTAIDVFDPNIVNFINDNDWNLLLIKGSRGLCLEKIVDKITQP